MLRVAVVTVRPKRPAQFRFSVQIDDSNFSNCKNVPNISSIFGAFKKYRFTANTVNVAGPYGNRSGYSVALQVRSTV